MKIYHYDPITKVYSGETEARLDPLESERQGKEIYLIPAYAIPVAPEKPKEGEAVIIDNGNWVCVPIPEKPEEIPHVETPEEISLKEKVIKREQDIKDIEQELLSSETKTIAALKTIMLKMLTVFTKG